MGERPGSYKFEFLDLERLPLGLSGSQRFKLEHMAFSHQDVLSRRPKILVVPYLLEVIKAILVGFSLLFARLYFTLDLRVVRI